MSLDISESRFLFLKSMKSILNEALEIEEKYEYVISNLIDLEKEAIEISVSDMISRPREYTDFFEVKLRLNKRVSNLLSSIKLYLDKVGSHASRCLSDDIDATKEKIEQLKSVQFDKNFNYRVMEALRNHSQHYGLLGHYVELKMGWVEKERKNLEHSVALVAEKTYFAKNKKFKKSLLDEIPDKLDLLSAMRSYIESLSSIHDSVRELVSSSVSAARFKIQEATEDYYKTNDKKGLSISAYKYLDDTKCDSVLLTLNWDDVRESLVRKNQNLISYSKKYVSSKAHSR